jgi:hypothetical protein
MWGLLRIILLIANAALFALLIYFVVIEHYHYQWQQWLVACGLMIFLVLNFVCLLLANRPSNLRIFRLIGLWFDAKESELRQRADRSRQDK